jgi:hypothetical protein
VEKTTEIVYNVMLELWLLPQLLENKPSAVFQQDGALRFIYHSVTTLIAHFPGRPMDW